MSAPALRSPRFGARPTSDEAKSRHLSQWIQHSVQDVPISPPKLPWFQTTLKTGPVPVSVVFRAKSLSPVYRIVTIPACPEWQTYGIENCRRPVRIAQRAGTDVGKYILLDLDFFIQSSRLAIAGSKDVWSPLPSRYANSVSNDPQILNDDHCLN